MQGECHVKMKAEIGLRFTSQKHQRSSENHQKPGERHRTESKKEGAKPDNSPVSGFQLPEL